MCWGGKQEEIKLNTVWHRLDQTQSSLLIIQTSISRHVTGSGSKPKHVQGSGSADTSECGSAAGAEGRSLNAARRTAKSGITDISASVQFICL